MVRYYGYFILLLIRADSLMLKLKHVKYKVRKNKI